MATGYSLQATTPLLGVGLNTKTTTPVVAQGTIIQANQGRLALYIQATAAIGANNQVTITGANTITGSSVAVGSWINGSVAFAASEYGWVYRSDLS